VSLTNQWELRRHNKSVERIIDAPWSLALICNSSKLLLCQSATNTIKLKQLDHARKHKKHFLTIRTTVPASRGPLSMLTMWGTFRSRKVRVPAIDSEFYYFLYKSQPARLSEAIMLQRNSPLFYALPFNGAYCLQRWTGDQCKVPDSVLTQCPVKKLPP